MLSTPLELVLALALALNGVITSGRRNWSSRFRCAKLARKRGLKKKMTPKTSTSTDFRLSRPWHQFDITSACILLGICYICHLIIRRGSKKKGFSRVSCFCERESLNNKLLQYVLTENLNIFVGWGGVYSLFGSDTLGSPFA